MLQWSHTKSLCVKKLLKSSLLRVAGECGSTSLWPQVSLAAALKKKKNKVVFFRQRTGIGSASLTKGPFSSRLYFTTSFATFVLSNWGSRYVNYKAWPISASLYPLCWWDERNPGLLHLQRETQRQQGYNSNYCSVLNTRMVQGLIKASLSWTDICWNITGFVWGRIHKYKCKCC